MISKRALFTFFLDFGSPETLEIKPKRCTVCKKRGSTFFDKSPHFLKQMVKKEPPNAPQTAKNT
jgi:hypothetical protein